jgi:hypothetical protein
MHRALYEGLSKDLYGNCRIDVYVGDSEPPCRTSEDWLHIKHFEKLSILCSCEVSRRRVDCYEVVLRGIEKRSDLVLSFCGVEVRYDREVVEAWSFCRGLTIQYLEWVCSKSSSVSHWSTFRTFK